MGSRCIFPRRIFLCNFGNNEQIWVEKRQCHSKFVTTNILNKSNRLSHTNFNFFPDLNFILDLNKDTSNGICIRKSLWSEDHIGTKAEDRYNCKGVVKRGICNLSIDDLPEIFKSGCLYANKFDLMANDGLVIKCMHEYLTQ